MNAVSISDLLNAEEEQLHRELQADASVDHNRRQSIERLNTAISDLLLRYNASCSDEPSRQALADSVTAPMLDMTELLMAVHARRVIEKRRIRTGAVIALLLSVICALLGALLFNRSAVAGYVLFISCAVCSFVAGRMWYGERKVQIQEDIDTELLMKTLKRAFHTVDRKCSDYLAQEHADDRAKTESSSEELQLFGELLEGLYSQHGEFALRQLAKLPPFLNNCGFAIY